MPGSWPVRQFIAWQKLYTKLNFVRRRRERERDWHGGMGSLKEKGKSGTLIAIHGLVPLFKHSIRVLSLDLDIWAFNH